MCLSWRLLQFRRCQVPQPQENLAVCRLFHQLYQPACPDVWAGQVHRRPNLVKEKPLFQFKNPKCKYRASA